jgi:hypothetical protein
MCVCVCALARVGAMLVLVVARELHVGCQGVALGLSGCCQGVAWGWAFLSPGGRQRVHCGLQEVAEVC